MPRSRGIDQADSSADSRMGATILPEYRKRRTAAFSTRSPAGSGASGFSSSKITKLGAFRSPPRTSRRRTKVPARIAAAPRRSEEHTSELQSQSNLVCRLLLEKKKNNK